MSVTVRVRIVVGVDRDGSWYAEGSSRHGASFDPAMIVVEAESLFIVEADLPVPQVVTVAGTTQPVKP